MGSFLFLVCPLQCSYRVPGNLNFDVFGYSKLNPVVLESRYRTVNPARSDDLISGFQIINHFLKLFLATAGRQKDDQIEDPKNKDER